MNVTRARQNPQIRKSDVFDDTVVPSLANYETNPVFLEDDLNNIRSMLSHLLDVQVGNWYDVIPTPGTFEGGAQRGVADLNQDLHDFERKRVLRDVYSLIDVTVPAAQNYVILGTGELPSNTTAAVGIVTTLGTVVAAHGGTFGTHSLAEVSGPNALRPRNLMEIVDGATGDPILDSGGETIYGLLQSENPADGHTITDTTPNRVQISFVKINATRDDLEAVAVADIENLTINYSTRERTYLLGLNEYDFLRGAVTDDPTAATSVTRQNVYDNQGVTPVDLTTNAILDLEGAGLFWELRDDLEATLFRVTEGSAGGTSTVLISADVDTLDVNAVANDFANGASFDTAGTPIQIAETAGVIERAADLYLRASGAGELILDDSYRSGSTWSLDGVRWADSSAEWNELETRFGEVSVANMLAQAYDAGADPIFTRAKVNTATINANVDVGGPTGANNLDTNLPDSLTVGTFTTNHALYVNGALQWPAADAAGNQDYYPSPTNFTTGDVNIRFEGTGIVLRSGDALVVWTWP